jgi:O-acetyl-ADP-ribose deacetylase (regulator of RNase III)
MLRVVLSAVEDPLARAWRRWCGEFDFVEVHEGSITDLEVDAVVSPANSFGFMDGGIDAVYLDHFGAVIQTRVRREITEHHHGGLLVGEALIVATDEATIPFLIGAPTMRVPMRLAESDHPYLAARAVLLLVEHGRFASGSRAGEAVRKSVASVAMPGLGTGVGGILGAVCAYQVSQAIKEVLLGEHLSPRSSAEAIERHRLLVQPPSAC